MILSRVRVSLIFIGFVGLPLFLAVLLDKVGGVIGAPAFVFFLLWKMLVLPHDQLLVSSAANAPRVFPGAIALWVAVAQWGGTAFWCPG